MYVSPFVNYEVLDLPESLEALAWNPIKLGPLVVILIVSTLLFQMSLLLYVTLTLAFLDISCGSLPDKVSVIAYLYSKSNPSH